MAKPKGYPVGPVLGILFFLLFVSLPASAREDAPGKDLRIVRITPAGEEVPPGRQVVIQFDRQVVPLGRMERKSEELPIAIEPQLNCRWRWLNGTTLACNLNEEDALQPATEYRITVRPGIETPEQATLAEPVHHRFSTERPRVTEMWFRAWLAPGLPQSALRFNMPMAEESLAAHLFYRLEDGTRIPTRIGRDPDYGSAGRPDNRMWLVSPAAELPAETAGELVIEPGTLALTGGGAPGTEQRVLDRFHPIPEFRFLGVRCTSADNQAFEIPPVPESGQDQRRCLPSGGVSLLFSAPVQAEGLKNGLQFSPPLTGHGPEGDPWDQIYSYSRLFEPHQQGKTYAIDLPENFLRPDTAYLLQLSAGVTDEFGRNLAQSARATFATDHRAPDFALLKNMPVLEKNLDSDAHVWAVNLAELRLEYQALTAAGGNPGTKTITPVGPRNTAIPVPMEIRSLVGGESGIVQGSFATVPAVPGKAPEESWFFAQVTPFQVHLKLGHHNSLVWITDLASGNPVEGVDVRVLKSTFKDLDRNLRPLAQGKTDAEGVAMLPGTAAMDPRLQYVWGNGREEPGLFLFCEKEGEDGGLAVLPLRYDYHVSAEGANREYIPDWLRPLHGHIRAWGATAQGIYKVGDTVQYKIFVRDQDNLRFTRPPGAGGAEAAAKAPPRYHLKVFDPQDKVVYEQDDIAISPFGTHHGEFALAKNGAVGWYRFLLSASFTSEEWEAMRVLVSDFTPAPFRVTTDLKGETFGAGDTVTVESMAKLHAGGAYSGAAAKLAATLEARPFTPDNPLVRGFSFDSTEDNRRRHGTETVHQTEGNLDDQGRWENSFGLPETPIWYGRLNVESSVRDDRGKSIAGRAAAAYFGRDRYVGLLQEDWTLQENRAARVRLAVVDREGRLVEGVPVKLTTEHKTTWGARVKGAGDAYLTEYEHAWELEEELAGVSSADRPLEFTFTPARAGSLRLVAAIADTEGRTHTTVIERWVTGKGVVLWASTPGNLLNVYPEKSSYDVGETARFLVQNPFPGSRALITVERFGVIDRWVATFPDSSAVVEIPVRPDYLPGFYVSVTVTAPRVEKPLGPQGEDLGKPTYRMGYVKIPVKDPYKELEVQVRPGRETYKPRDTVRVELAVRPRHLEPGEAAPPVELAVAVLDEAVFDLLLQGRRAFDPYQGFYFLDELDLRNYSLLMQLVGREKMELKGASPGGGGGPDLGMRSLFKFVSYWNPSLIPDVEGRADIEFEVPDNLTGWRVLVMAVSPEDRMGLGEAVFKVNQATEIRPALPNQVLEGDSFSAGFTFMNRTDQPRKLGIECTARGPVQGAAGDMAVRFSRVLTLAPYQRETLFFPLTTMEPGTVSLSVAAGDETDRDGLAVSLPVRAREYPEVVAGYGLIDNAIATEPILFPEMGKEGGELTLTLSPSVIGGITGSFAFLRDYPYSCWEQKLSRAVLAALYGPLKPYLPADFAWPDSEKVARETLALAGEFQAPNGGMTFYQPKDEFVSPYLGAFTALAFNRLRQEGYPAPAQVEQRLHDYLQNLLRHEAVPDEYSRGMTATVRAERGGAASADALRYLPQLPTMSLFGKALYLRTLLNTGATFGQQREVLDGLLAHADRSAGRVVFRETLDTGFSALLSSTTRDNAAILGALIAWVKVNPNDSAMRELAVNLMRTISESRKAGTHWPSTQDNLFVAMALTDYAKSFEERQPDMQVAGRLDRLPLGAGRLTAYTEPPLVFRKAVEARDAGRRTLLHLEKIGAGNLYYTTRLAYTPRQRDLSPVNAGIEVHREYSVKRNGNWQLLTGDMAIRTGEVVKIDLFVSLPAERYFVVLDDPVPGGLEPVNRELATAAHADAETEKALEAPVAEGSYHSRFPDWVEDTFGRWSFYHRELRHDAARFYSERLAAGRYHLSYTAQAIAPGEFLILPAHAEEMYAPEVFGDSAPAKLSVTAAR